jgi:hypothetical protein
METFDHVYGVTTNGFKRFTQLNYHNRHAQPLGLVADGRLRVGLLPDAAPLCSMQPGRRTAARPHGRRVSRATSARARANGNTMSKI